MGLMKNLLKPMLLALALLAIFGAEPGRAQGYLVAYVSNSGSDNNNCATEETSCRRLTRALAVVRDEGTIRCIQPGFSRDYEAISKPVTIDCQGGMISRMDINPSNGTIVILGLSSSGRGYYSRSLSITGAGAVVLQRVNISGGATAGIEVAPTGPLSLTIADSTIAAGGSGTAGAGVLVKPSGGGSARVALERTTVSSSVFGIAFDGSNSTAGINATIKDSMISGNSQDGIVATTTSGHAPIGVFVSGSASSNNVYGVRAIGPNVTVRVEDTKITGNNTGLAASGGGGLLSYGNNKVDANGSNGAFTGSVAQK
jgi:hypothetical protein